MKLLVLSDSHGDFSSVQNVIYENSSIDTILHLGDGNGDVEQLMHLYPQKEILAVRGNCDFYSELPQLQMITIADKKIFMTHGKEYGVKIGLSTVCSVARKNKADILLFGHTHNAFVEEQAGLVIMNPGSLRGYSGTYGILEIIDGKIMANIKYSDKAGFVR